MLSTAPRVIAILDLEPSVTRASAVGGVRALRDDAFVIAVDDRAEQRLAVRLDMLDDLNRQYCDVLM